jgi:hypothetical protein
MIYKYSKIRKNILIIKRNKYLCFSMLFYKIIVLNSKNYKNDFDNIPNSNVYIFIWKFNSILVFLKLVFFKN